MLILDTIHALEYIWLIANANYRESSDEGKEYVYDKLQLILRGKVASYIMELEDEMKSEKLKKWFFNEFCGLYIFIKSTIISYDRKSF